MEEPAEFSQVFLSVQYLSDCVKKPNRIINESTVNAFIAVIDATQHQSQRQAFFLFKEAALALVYLSNRRYYSDPATVISRLQRILISSTGARQRAVSEALGTLPLEIKGPPQAPVKGAGKALEISFNTLLAHISDEAPRNQSWHGRTLRVRLSDQRIMCIKFANCQAGIELLLQEIRWLIFLEDKAPGLSEDFHVPRPVQLETHTLFKLTGLPVRVPDSLTQNDETFPAIVFVTDDSYYRYPNEPDLFKNAEMAVPPIFTKNARLLGRLSAHGIIHTAVIPLFHNRVQQERREDEGVYLWEHGGRLDQWLKSCRYPNFAESGPRDFEHLLPLSTSKRLSHYIGEHILGFTLVIGSFFRNKSPELFGSGPDNTPLDLRYLFNPDLFYQLFSDTVTAYYNEFTGADNESLHGLVTRDLISRLIEVMGVDRHMEETLRIEDQTAMTDEQFYQFLEERGYPPEGLHHLVRGQGDVTLVNGPHLGGFNQPISVPELTSFLFTLSSLCISERYLTENGLKQRAN